MKKLIYAFIFCVVASACSKSDGDNSSNTPTPTPATKTELITAKPWKYTAWTVNPPVKDNNNNSITDILGNKPACDQDDILIFNANGNVIFDQGPTKCDDATPQTSTAGWAFKAGETQMDMANRLYNIKTLTANELKIEFEDIVGNKIHIHTVTFNH
jgi:hypothetical protein